MTRSSLALALGLLTATAACGDPDCDTAVRHGAKLLSSGGFGYGGRVGDRDVQLAITQCKSEKWSADLRNCIVSSRNLLDLRGCERHRKH
jgi:hypothetical protein